jgi:perosamine synthetase
MISYGKQSIGQDDIDAVVDVLKSDWLTQGPAVEAFEASLNKYFGSKYSCALSNGTAALHLAGLALDWKPGDIVITTPLTFLATANCIIYSGATPDFVDIDPVSYTIDPILVEKKIQKYQKMGKRVKAIIGVDFAGHPCDWKALRKIADKYDLQLINDNCHALGASYFGNKQYAVEYADIVTHSYHPVKHLTTGEGGAILTNNSDLVEKVKRLRSHGMTKDPSLMDSNDGPWYYEMHELGYNYRITDFQSALGSNQLKKLDKFGEERREIATQYDNSFVNTMNLKIPKAQSFVEHAYHLYPLQVYFDKINLSKVQFFRKMKNNGINLQVHYNPIHLQPYYHKRFGFKKGDFPISENFYRYEISLPIYPQLSSNDTITVINSILKLLNT